MASRLFQSTDPAQLVQMCHEKQGVVKRGGGKHLENFEGFA